MIIYEQYFFISSNLIFHKRNNAKMIIFVINYFLIITSKFSIYLVSILTFID